jgi:hypothetical protein
MMGAALVSREDSTHAFAWPQPFCVTAGEALLAATCEGDSSILLAAC